MLKLRIENIKKTYKSSELVIALKGVSMGFRQSEFVSILGPSGCGKTTLLNIIGGLDQYDRGDLIINGVSTKQYKGADWDAYRNRSIGFVFQSYNLISHQSVLQNVEIAMTLSGISASERKQRAKQALIDVGLEDQMKKRPNQLSGGQMQRVAIARALVNNPDIILADEPTGALDSKTSVQIMEILKEVAKTRLVIMVTHNGDLAQQYSSRIIRLLDGKMISDSMPITEEELNEDSKQGLRKVTYKKTSMNLFTAAALSFKNLLSKMGRTTITSFAGSIGIIGVALVLALSNGLNMYMDTVQTDSLAGYPITITAGDSDVDLTRRPDFVEVDEVTPYEEFPAGNVLYSYDPQENTTTHTNVLTKEFMTYIDGLEETLPGAVNNISYSYGVSINLLAKAQDTVVKFETSAARTGSPFNFGNIGWQELPTSDDFVLSMYDLIGDGSRLPRSSDEVVLVVDEYNRLEQSIMEKLGFTISDESSFQLTDFIGQSILSVIPNNNFYSQNGDLFKAAAPDQYEELYTSDAGIDLTIVGILRLKPDAASSYLNTGIAYTPKLTDVVLSNAQNSKVAQAQVDADFDVLTAIPFSDDEAKNRALLRLGANTEPTGINIYPTDFASKENIKAYLDDYNADKNPDDQLIYSDLAETITDITGSLLNTVTLVLVGFAAISLLVSTIMIAIITYVSVIERTKEIGILRSVGARKKDISRVFNAETLIIGFTAGVMGVVLSYLLTIPINAVILKIAEIDNIAVLDPINAILLVAGSMILTLIAGFIPSRMAANKDPVVALRTE